MWMAIISLALTIENVIIIFIVSRFMFWIKNVYIPDDQNKDVWQSVTNFKHQYKQLKSRRMAGLMMERRMRDFEYEYGDEGLLNGELERMGSNFENGNGDGDDEQEYKHSELTKTNMGSRSTHTELTSTKYIKRRGNKRSLKSINFEFADYLERNGDCLMRHYIMHY